MLFRLVSPVQRKGSKNCQFQQRIPADVKARAMGRALHIPVGTETVVLTITRNMPSVRFSLRTANSAEAKIRQAQAIAYLETVWQAIRGVGEPARLAQRQIAALAGEIYRAWADESRQRTTAVDLQPDGRWAVIEPSQLEEPEEWTATIRHIDALMDAGEEALERAFWRIIERRLLAKGIASVTPETRKALLHAFAQAFRDATEARRREAEGDFSPDPKVRRFPEWEAQPAKASNTHSISLRGLVEDWWREAEKAGRTISTYESYRRTFHNFADFLKHDDASAITPADIVAYKDRRIAEGVRAKTVGDSDISALRSVFEWGVRNAKLKANPAKDIRVTRTKPVQTRSKSLMAEEAKAILSHALHHRQGREHAKTFAAKRWVPWLCAYTGARVGELVQLRKQDVRREAIAGQDADAWVITITPEAGTVKDKEAREVVLHDHLIELGFATFVERSRDGHLFMTPKQNGDTRGPWRTVKNRLTDFARQVVSDPRVAPNHGWRHLFKTKGREAGIEDSVLDAICGHAPTSVGGSYGEVSLKAKRDAMAKFPRFELNGDRVGDA